MNSLTVKEVAERLGICRQKVYTLIDKGDLIGYIVGVTGYMKKT